MGFMLFVKVGTEKSYLRLRTWNNFLHNPAAELSWHSSHNLLKLLTTLNDNDLFTLQEFSGLMDHCRLEQARKRNNIDQSDEIRGSPNAPDPGRCNGMLYTQVMKEFLIQKVSGNAGVRVRNMKPLFQELRIFHDKLNKDIAGWNYYGLYFLPSRYFQQPVFYLIQ